MLFKKSTTPEEGEIILCTVTKIYSHSVFVALNEYPGKNAMLHISEISPGRIRNIGDYVKEGKVIVCKVLRINQEQGHIDVSLRRVSESERRAKSEEMKQEQKAKKIVEYVAQQQKIPIETLYEEIQKSVPDEYSQLHMAFNDIALGKIDLSKVTPKAAALIKETIMLRIKPPIVEVKGKLKLESHDSNGLKIVKDTLKQIEGIGANVFYLGAGAYQVEFSGEDFKVLESKFEKAQEILEKVDNKQCAHVLERK